MFRYTRLKACPCTSCITICWYGCWMIQHTNDPCRWSPSIRIQPTVNTFVCCWWRCTSGRNCILIRKLFPAASVVTAPVLASIVATDVLLLLQVPPASPLLVYVAYAPIHNGDVHVITPAFAFALTVNGGGGSVTSRYCITDQWIVSSSYCCYWTCIRINCCYWCIWTAPGSACIPCTDICCIHLYTMVKLQE